MGNLSIDRRLERGFPGAVNDSENGLKKSVEKSSKLVVNSQKMRFCGLCAGPSKLHTVYGIFPLTKTLKYPNLQTLKIPLKPSPTFSNLDMTIISLGGVITC